MGIWNFQSLSELLFSKQAAPGSSPTGKVYLYVGTDGRLRTVDGSVDVALMPAGDVDYAADTTTTTTSASGVWATVTGPSHSFTPQFGGTYEVTFRGAIWVTTSYTSAASCSLRVKGTAGSPTTLMQCELTNCSPSIWTNKAAMGDAVSLFTLVGGTQYTFSVEVLNSTDSNTVVLNNALMSGAGWRIKRIG